ncbi:MAG: PKD domain-containing protein [Acidobacteriota bacterium]
MARRRTIKPGVTLLAFSAFALHGATLPPHPPLRILIVSDLVNPHNLPPNELTEPGDLSAAILTPGSGINIDTLPNSVYELPTNSIEIATSLLSVPRTDPMAYDVVIYFCHRIPNNGNNDQLRQDAFVNAVDAFLTAGGGFISFHHGSYASAGKQGILDIIGATASGAVPYDTVNGQNVIDVAPGHFVTGNGVAYTGTISYSDPGRGVPPGTYAYFNNTPDERYPVFDINPTASQFQVLFGSDYNDTGTTHLLGFTHKRPSWAGVVVGYQPGEYQPNSCDVFGPNFQILANAIVWASGVLAAPPAADFIGAPLSGAPPLAVQFTDLSTGGVTSYAWDFGDGGTSSTQSPAHTYTTAGTYTVSLTATGPGGSDTETKAGYVIVTASSVANLLTGLGPDPAAAPRIQAWTNVSQPYTPIDFNAYGTNGYGVNAGHGEINAGGTDEILTAPGPSPVFGPQVRAFLTPSATPIAKVSYFAYGTLKFGAHAEGGDLDGDAIDEILTTPGPGAVFGPHVRGWNFDGAVLTAISKVSFFGFSTLRYGARVSGGTIDADSFAEIVVGAGPGAVFSAAVRAFDYDGAAVTPIAKVNFIAYNGLLYGAEVATAELDGDAYDEILTGPGAAPANPAQARGWNYDGAALGALPGLDFAAYAGSYGVLVAGGDVDGDGKAEVLTMPADPAQGARALGWDYESQTITPISAIDFVADPSKGYGGNIEAGALGF